MVEAVYAKGADELDQQPFLTRMMLNSRRVLLSTWFVQP